MAEQLRTAKVDMAFPPALFIIDAETSIQSLPTTLTQDITFEKGCLVSAASPTGPFAKFAVGAIPAATDVVGVIGERKATVAGDVLHYVYIKGAFALQFCLTASGLAPDATQLAALKEVFLKQGIYLVPTKG